MTRWTCSWQKKLQTLFDSDRYITIMYKLFWSDNTVAQYIGGEWCWFHRTLGWHSVKSMIGVETMVPPSIGRCWMSTYIRYTNPWSTELWFYFTGDLFNRKTKKILCIVWSIVWFFLCHLIHKSKGWNQTVGPNSSDVNMSMRYALPK